MLWGLHTEKGLSTAAAVHPYSWAIYFRGTGFVQRDVVFIACIDLPTKFRWGGFQKTIEHNWIELARLQAHSIRTNGFDRIPDQKGITDVYSNQHNWGNKGKRKWKSLEGSDRMCGRLNSHFTKLQLTSHSQLRSCQSYQESLYLAGCKVFMSIRCNMWAYWITRAQNNNKNFV